MSKKAVDVAAQIERVRSLGRDYLPVANLAEIGLAVVEAVRKAGGLPRGKRANGPAGKPKASKGEKPPVTELGL